MTMKIHLAIYLSLLVAVNAYEIWPHPKQMKMNDTFLSIDPKNFTIHSKTNGECQVLNRAIERYLDRMFIQDCSLVNEQFRGRYLSNKTENFKKMTNYSGQMTTLLILVHDKCETMPNTKMNEAYTVKIDKDHSVIESKSVWGALRGLETFSQMFRHVGKNQFSINTGQIDDEPRFAFRGVMLDSSRHFLPLHAIYETLDAMEMNKFNVFHWHIVDDQSFPFVSTTFPELSKKGSYRSNFIYTPEDVQKVLRYANDRGIRLIPEFDSPGHTESWGKGQPNLLTQCYDGKGKPIPNSYGPINPVLNSTYEFIQKLFHEIAERFPDQYMHLGGDEVDFGCWKSNPILQEFMKINQFGDDYAKLESYYITKLIDIVQNLNRSYIVWQEVFDNEVKIRPETVVHVWKNGALWQMEMKNVTKAGYQALLSSCWYLNYISYGNDWYKYYQCDPQNFNGTIQEQNLVTGGEACLWGEFIDASNLISRTWPRACAVAERLWSPKSFKDPKKAKTRFHGQRCRMQILGLKVEPIEGPDFCYCDDAI
uniref:Beta-hexosaminidase n=1 Tax=Dermatophagoides pteronyssinus TaxID=6956 RepID=A0A6P6Y194_DERPT|nr:beta-hexosaminidase subunit beta-like [Dermatophagoides pteronyssinus]